jgi:hypothetical protein
MKSSEHTIPSIRDEDDDGHDDDEEEDISIDDDPTENDNDDEEEQQQLPARKRKRGRPPPPGSTNKGTKKKKRKVSGASEGKKQKRLERAIREAEADFEQSRDDFLSKIPKYYKAMFGKIRFTKWKKGMTPVLIMHPFNVPPGEVRNMRLRMYEKVRKKLVRIRVTASIV